MFVRRDATQEAWKLLIVQHSSTFELSTKGQVVRDEFQKDLFRDEIANSFLYTFEIQVINSDQVV